MPAREPACVEVAVSRGMAILPFAARRPGRELIERGDGAGVERAAALDLTTHLPRYDGVAFVDRQAS